MPTSWWDAVAGQAEDGDEDAIALLTDVRRPPLEWLEPSDSPQVLVVPLDIDDDELTGRIAATQGSLWQVVRVADPEHAEWGPHQYAGVVVAERCADRPMELRWRSDDEQVESEWQLQVPDRLRRRWLAHAPSAPGFRNGWNRHFDRQAGRFEEMMVKAPRNVVQVLIGRAVGHLIQDLEQSTIPDEDRFPTPLKPPSLFTVLRWAVRHRARWVLTALVELPDRWCADACLGGRPGAYSVSFSVPNGDMYRGQPDDLSWARATRFRLSAPALMTRWRALDELAHAAALALYDDHGERRALEERWADTEFGLSQDWRRRSRFLSMLPNLQRVSWPMIEQSLDEMPEGTGSWVRRQLSSISRGPTRDTGGWGPSRRVLAEADGYREAVPFASWLRFHATRVGHQACVLLRELAEGVPGVGPVGSHIDDPRVAIAAFTVGSLAEMGLQPDVAVPPAEVCAWLEGLPPNQHDYGLLDQTLATLLERRRLNAARALIKRGDRRPITAWFEEPRTSGVSWPVVCAALLQSPAHLGRWLAGVSLDNYHVAEDLLEHAIMWALPQLQRAWQQSTPANQRRIALKRPDHPQARFWLTVLFDEAWNAGRPREAALWAWLIHQHHAQDEPRTLRVVEHWALEDDDPFDRHGFRVSAKRLTGGAGALVEMMSTWAANPSWARREEAVRRLHALRVTEWPREPWSLWGRERMTDDEIEARRLPWLSFGYHEGVGGRRLEQHLRAWLRAIDATDVRDAAIEWDASDWSSIRPWALDWWLETVDDAGLRSRLTAMLADIGGQELDPSDARLGRAGALLREWLERDPQTVVDWMIERCDMAFRTTELVEEEEWIWILDHQEVGLDAMVDCIARHRLAAVDDIWGAWWSLTSTERRRRWVLRHLAWRATWNGPDAARAGVRLRRWALERP